ncbi:MAG: hypothetical protein IJ266_03265, partial [Elusimicrobiaceae bacterium]|nr:hypothetical protein [Elusimicrobiaceae bacterium]
GKIKEYHIVLSAISILTLPAAMVAVFLGGTVYSIGVILVVGSCLNSAGRVYFAQKLLKMSAEQWLKEGMFPILGLIVICCCIGFLPRLYFSSNFLRLIVTILIAESVFFPITWFFILSPSERAFILQKLMVLRHKLNF